MSNKDDICRDRSRDHLYIWITELFAKVLETVNLTIKNFLTAIKQVNRIHSETPYVKLINNEINLEGDKILTYENNFTTYLIEKYAMLQKAGTIDEPKNLIRHF